MIECSSCKTNYDEKEQGCPNCGEPAPGRIPPHCPYCGTGTQQGEKFCSGCGQEILPMAPPRCENCGAPLRIGAGFCAQCGEPVVGAHAPTQPVQAAQPLPLRIAEETTDDVSHRYKAEEKLEEKDFFGDPLSERTTTEEQVEDLFSTPPMPIVEAKKESSESSPDLSWPENQPDLHIKSEETSHTKQGEAGNKPTKEAKSALDRSQPLFENTEEFEEVKYAVKHKKKKKSGIWLLVLLILAIMAGVALVWLKLLPGAVGQKKPIEPKPSVVTPKEDTEETPTLPGEPNANPPGEKSEKKEFSFVAEMVIPTEWDKVTEFDEITGLARVTRDGKMGVIEADGNVLVPPTYDSIGEFKEEMAVIQRGDKYGYMDSSGREVIPPVYEDAKDFSEGFGGVANDGKYGFITKENSDVDFKYTTLSPYSNGLAAVSLGEQHFFVDTEGEQMSPMYESAGPFQNSLAPVKSLGVWGYVDTEFAEKIPLKYTMALPFENSLAIVQEGNKKFLINTQGEIMSPKVDDMWPMSEGVATVQVGAFYGFVDGSSKEEFLIDPQYTDVYAHSEGYFPVSSNRGIWYYVNSSGENVFNDIFDEAYSFKNGLARVKKDLKYTVINKVGEQVVINWWDGIGVYQFGLLPVEENGKWGFAKLV